MKEIEIEELTKLIKNGKISDLSFSIIRDCDLTGCNFSEINFSNSNFVNVCLNNVNFENSNLQNCLLDGCSLENVNFKNSNLRTASFRRANLKGADISGANLYGAVLEEADLKDVKFDSETKNFSIHCPTKGAFIAYKKCLNNLIVKLLVPSDAKRVSATKNCCRCDKAKILEIKNFEGTKYYNEAWSTVDDNFCYKLGKWVYADNFNENRWYDSTGGIHFWLSEEEAKNY